MQDLVASKKLSAFRQIRAAIVHFHANEFECAITLAAAGENQVPEGTVVYLMRLLRRRAASATSATPYFVLVPPMQNAPSSVISKRVKDVLPVF
jgi:hypothetical protein